MGTTREYKLISADGHFNEPGDLWTSRVPSEYKDLVPRIERFDEGNAWIIEGFPVPQPFGWGACAGLAPEDLNLWMRFEDLRPGSYDPVARVEEQDADRVDAEVLYPSGYPSNFVTGTKDPDMHLSMVRAYNDWLSEFCGTAPDRLGGCAILPNRGIDQCLGEIKRLEDMPGIVSYLLKCYPHGDTVISDEDDAVWAAIEATGKPMTIHVSLSNDLPSVRPAKSLPGTGHFYDAPKRMLEFIFAGVLDRFPNLTIFLAEVDCGWLPYFSDQADDNYMRHSRASLKDVKLKKLPSEYVRDHFPCGYVTDPYAIENRHRIGIERILWSNDYPHITSDWPNSWKVINATFADVPADERHAILAGNALRIFDFGQ